jgi:dTDP-4-dehydrorhamnose reductase
LFSTRIDTVPDVKAIVLGAGGQLGSDLSRLTGPGSGFAHDQLSVTDSEAIDALLSRKRPGLVFNCAAYNAVDRAESERDLAYAINAEGPANVARACARHRIRLVHFSSNYVFDGALDRPYVEADVAVPLSVYGASKLEGEKRVLAEQPNALVIRTSALFGDRGSAIKGGSFPDRILSRAMAGEPLRVVADQKVNPTYTAHLAPVVLELGESDLRGVVHVVAAGCAGWDELARAVLAEFDVAAEVEAASSAEFGAPARRPPNGCLASSRVEFQMRPWREGLHDWAARRAVDPKRA